MKEKTSRDLEGRNDCERFDFVTKGAGEKKSGARGEKKTPNAFYGIG